MVDDHEAVRTSLKFALEIEGLEVRLYGGPDELLSDADLPALGCLIINFQMPVMSGLELIARLRDRHISMPAILITGYSNKHLRERAVVAGVSIVEKPFFGSHLIDCIYQTFR